MNERNKPMQRAKPVIVRVRSSARAKPGQADKERAEPTAERMRRAGAHFERGDTGQITMRDSPLERLRARNVITQEQYAAAQKYRHHWYHAGLSDPLGSRDLHHVAATDFWNFTGIPKSEQQLFHRQRYREAVQAAGKLGSHVLDWSVCREVELERVGNTLGWSSRPQAYAAAVERLKMALDELCRLWGIGQ
jgi:Domain of unknown function (DUF6456)